MSNWPNIQEYRNFEAKFLDNLKRNDLSDSSAEYEEETVIEDEFKKKIDSDDVIYGQNATAEPKTVRCVIRKNFEESFKKLDRGDGVTVSNECVRPKIQETSTIDQSVADKIRLQNHLKWKRQKKEEYMQKKEAERIEQQKKREEEIRKEKIKKQKEREREEKIREWQEQKAREKEEKKQEKMVMKVLEEELKEVTPIVSKEKLIEEWVKLKNKQKKMEDEKKAEILKKEEESRAIRQNLAEMSYRQWKERIKGRMMALPKNGYQIFGPKPVPVVKEDWNHDFGSSSSSPRHHGIELGHTRSTTNTSLTFRTGIKFDEDTPKDICYLGELKNRSPSFYQLKTSKRVLNGSNGNEMPLKEIQPGTVGLKKNGSRISRNEYGERKDEANPSHFKPHGFRNKSESNLFAKNSEKDVTLGKNFLADYLSHLMPVVEGYQSFPTSTTSKPLKLLNEFSETHILPNKKKLDLFINTDSPNMEEENLLLKHQKKHTSDTNDHKLRERKKETGGKPLNKPKKKSTSKEKCCDLSNGKLCAVTSQNGPKLIAKGVNAEVSKRKSFESQKIKEKPCRRSRSYDKPVKKFTKEQEKVKGCSTSRSVVKITRIDDEACKLKLAKSKTSSCPKRRSRRQSKPVTPEPTTKPGKKQTESDVKIKKKPKKNAFPSKSLTFSNSPYCVNRNQSKSLDKTRAGRRKNGETKTDGVGQSRKSSATKI